MHLSAKYLRRSRTGIWYFRVSIPHALQAVFGRKELVRSLATPDRREALLHARALSVKVGWLFLQMGNAMAKGKDPTDLDLSKFGIDAGNIRFWNLRHPSGIEISSEPGNERDHQQAMEALRAVLDAQPLSQTPPSPSTTSSRCISELRDVLFSEKQDAWSPATRIEYGSALEQFIGFVGDRPAAEIQSRDIAAYTSRLRRQHGVSQRTIDKKLGPVAALFRLAQRDKDIPAGDLPTKGHFQYKKAKGKQAKNDGYAFFESRDLAKIFAPENLLSCGKPHEFWLPLLGIYTGARLNELCQIELADIRMNSNGTLVLDFAESGGKRLKTAASARTIPLHPSLVALGFLDYLEDVKEMGATRVFPYLRHTEKAGFGDVASEAFARYMKSIGLGNSGKVFHSLRKTANNTLASKGVHEEHRCAWMGHEHDTTNSQTYSQAPTPEFLLENVARHLAFPEIDAAALKYPKGRFEAILVQEMARRRRLEANRAARRGTDAEG